MAKPVFILYVSCNGVSLKTGYFLSTVQEKDWDVRESASWSPDTRRGDSGSTRPPGLDQVALGQVFLTSGVDSGADSLIGSPAVCNGGS
jgi:hypothetical protein